MIHINDQLEYQKNLGFVLNVHQHKSILFAPAAINTFATSLAVIGTRG